VSKILLFNYFLLRWFLFWLWIKKPCRKSSEARVFLLGSLCFCHSCWSSLRGGWWCLWFLLDYREFTLCWLDDRDVFIARLWCILLLLPNWLRNGQSFCFGFLLLI